MGLSRRKSLAGALSTTALATTGCAGTVAEPGDMTVLVSSPFSVVVLLVAVLAVAGPPVLRRFRQREAVPA